MPRNLYGKNPHYQFRDQDPVIDIMRSWVKTSGLPLKTIAENAGLTTHTLQNWFTRKSVRVPRHDSVQIFFRSFGVTYGVQERAVRSVVRRVA